MEKTRWSTLTACLLALLALGLFACGDDDSADDGGGASGGGGSSGEAESSTEGVKVAFANLTAASSLFQPVAAGAEDAAAKAGMELEILDNRFDPQVTLKNAQTMVQGKPDVIIEYSPAPAIGKSLFTIFDRAGIPCIALNVEVEGCPWLNVVNEVLGGDAGKAAAEAASEKGWDGTNTTVLLLGNATGGEEVNDTVRYFYTAIADALPGFEKVPPDDIQPTLTKIGETGRQVDGKGTLEGGFAAVKNVLPSIPKDRNIIMTAVNDDAALGGWRAIDEAGRGDKALVVGLGGSKEALQQLRDNPSWGVEVSAFLSVWGYYAMAMAAATADGAEIPEFTRLPHLALTPDTVDDYYPPNSDLPKQLPPLPEESSYLEGYGILESYGE